MTADLIETQTNTHPKHPKPPKAPKAPKAPKPPKAPKASDERYTPEDVLDVVRALTGKIILDPCTTKDNRTGATYFFTAETNGLDQDWWALSQGETIYVNPPFSDLRGWTNKCRQEADKGCSIVMLLPGDTSTNWFHNSIAVYADVICHWKGRIKFITPEKPYGTGAKQPTMFAYFGKDTKKFIEVFKNYGKLALPHKEGILTLI